MPAKRIYRNTREKVVGGVCAGIADYFDVDVAWIRLAFVLSVFASGFGLLAYIIAWIVFPRDDRVSAEVPAAPSAHESVRSGSARDFGRKAASGSRNAAGIILVLLGVLFFMDQNFWWFRFDAFWPVILIGLGLYLLLRPSALAESSESRSPMSVASASTSSGATGAPSEDTRES